jgi:hypothetical protein
MESTATINATRDEEAGMTTDGQHIRLVDGPVVHDHLIFQDDNGAWWAYNDGSLLYATGRDEVLVKVAEATGSSTDLEDLHGRYSRAMGRVASHRAEEAAWEVFDGNRPPNTGRCPRCGGTGKVHQGAGTVKCPTCGGAGVVRTS